jgi:type IV secretory pathway VirB9-like protein
MYLDKWYMNPSKPIDIPVKKKMNVKLMTRSGDIDVNISSYNEDLISGYVNKTPPSTKIYKKGDKVMFHKDNIIDYIKVPTPIYIE